MSFFLSNCFYKVHINLPFSLSLNFTTTFKNKTRVVFYKLVGILTNVYFTLLTDTFYSTGCIYRISPNIIGKLMLSTPYANYAKSKIYTSTNITFVDFFRLLVYNNKASKEEGRLNKKRLVIC